MVWRDRDWRDEAIAWAERRLAERGRRVSGKAEQIHVVPWSTVLRIPTDRGAVYFKATWPPQRHEAAITEALARWAPDQGTAVLALDRRRGWLLAEDAGPRLREVLAKDRDIRRWHAVLPRYAELQLKTAPHVSELLKLDVPDRRADALAMSYERLLKDRSLMRIGLKEGLSAVQHERLRGMVPQVREWAMAISAAIPATIQHDDLHDGQVFVRDGHYRILDWGDACVSHPFYSLSVILRSTSEHRVHVQAQARRARARARSRRVPGAVHSRRDQNADPRCISGSRAPGLDLACAVVGAGCRKSSTGGEKKRARQRAALTSTFPRSYSFGLTTILGTRDFLSTQVAFAIISVHPGIVSTVVTR